jgi:hypothetical protein
MSFHKRIFSVKLIREKSKDFTYSEFRKWVISSDSHIFRDEESYKIILDFLAINEEGRMKLYDQLRND